jgi:hypothetical protein
MKMPAKPGSLHSATDLLSQIKRPPGLGGSLAKAISRQYRRWIDYSGVLQHTSTRLHCERFSLDPTRGPPSPHGAVK